MNVKRLAWCAAACWALIPECVAAQSAPTAALPAVSNAVATWENRGSDIPVDPSWRFGTLPNGVRYAVRRGSQPPGAISVRVRIGVGAVMEADAQQGWTHLLEHMVFRGTEHYPDGEGIKLWQRLGASFGSDTNAATTQTSTTFQLDLPHADAAGYGEAMSVLAEMMDSARMDPALLATERQVVDAERAQRFSPLIVKLQDAQQALLYAGTKAATRDVIGTSATLAAASSQALKAYYEAWYRPDNAVVVVAGDADPALLEDGIRRAFGAWKPTGPRPADPDWGVPAAPKSRAAIVADPQAPNSVLLDFVSPHPEGPFTIARQEEQYAELVALGILNQRLAVAARQGGAIVNAATQRLEQPRIEDQLLVQLQPKSGQWQDALKQAFAVLNGSVASPPEQPEIDQIAANIATAFAQRVASASTQTSPALATAVVTDVEQGDVTGSPEFYAKLFAAQRPHLTPAAVQAALRRLLAPAPRVLIVSSSPVPGGEAGAEAALAAAEKVAAGQVTALRNVSLDQIKLAGTPARLVATTPLPALGAERIRFSNGVELVFKKTGFEKDRVRIAVQVGRGLLGEPRNRQGLWWTAGALAAGGIGPFTPEELARAAAGRQVMFNVAPSPDAFVLGGASNGADVGDMMKLMTAQITQPRFDANAVARVKEATSATYASVFSQPVSVFGVFGRAALHGGDTRFQVLPPLDAVRALSPPEFERFWTERLAQGPVRVVVVGDADRDRIVAAVARTFGTLAPRKPAPLFEADLRAAPPPAPAVLHHQGDPNQALVLRVFPTLGLGDDASAGAALDIAAAIVETRLTEGFRATEGGTYTPFASHSQAAAMPHYGVLIAGAQVQTGRIDPFGASLAAVLADIAAKGPSPDAFSRAQATAISAAERSRADNGWWVGTLASELDAKRVAEIAGAEAALKAVTPADVKAAAARYLAPGRGFSVEVLATAAAPPGK
ncbi:MAG: zinc protease [Sphingomonadales bacterium]|jgi:zinc protease|nr:zinc protease [Sphingomonadales bacterium]